MSLLEEKLWQLSFRVANAWPAEITSTRRDQRKVGHKLISSNIEMAAAADGCPNGELL